MPGRVILIRKGRKNGSPGKKLAVGADHIKVTSAAEACSQDATSKTTPLASEIHTPIENLQPQPSTSSSRLQVLETPDQTSITASDYQKISSQPGCARKSSVIGISQSKPTAPVPPSTKPMTLPHLKETHSAGLSGSQPARSNTAKATIKLTANSAVLERTSMSISVPCCSKEPDPAPYPTPNTPSSPPEIVHVCCGPADSESTNQTANGTFKVPPCPSKRAPKTSVASVVRTRAAVVTPNATVISTLAPTVAPNSTVTSTMQHPCQGQLPRATVAHTASVASNAATSSIVAYTPMAASESRGKQPKRKYTKRKLESEKKLNTEEIPEEQYFLDTQRAIDMALAYKKFHNFRRLRFLFPKIPAPMLNDILVACQGQLATVIDKIMKEDKKARQIAMMNCNRNPADLTLQPPRQPFPQIQGMQQTQYANQQPPAAPMYQRNAHDTYRLNNLQYNSDFHFANSNGNHYQENNFRYTQGKIEPPWQSSPQTFDTIGHMARSQTNVADGSNGRKESNSQNYNVNWQQPNAQHAPVYTSGGMSGEAVPSRLAAQNMVPQGMASKEMMSQGDLPVGFGPSRMAPQMYQRGAHYGYGPSGMLHPRLMAQGGMPGGFGPPEMPHPQLMTQGVVPGGYGTVGMMPSGMPSMMTPQNIMPGGMFPSGTQAMPPGMIFSGMVHSDHSQSMVQGMTPMNILPDMVTGMVRPARAADISTIQPPQVAPQSQFANNRDCIQNSATVKQQQQQQQVQQYNRAMPAAAVAGLTFSTSYASLTATTAGFQQNQQTTPTMLSDDQRITQLLQLEQQQQLIQRQKEHILLQQQLQQQNQPQQDRQQQEHQQQLVEQLKKQQLQLVVQQRLQHRLQQLLTIKHEQQQLRPQQQQEQLQQLKKHQQHQYQQEQQKLLQKQQEHNHLQLQVNQDQQLLQPIRDIATSLPYDSLVEANEAAVTQRMPNNFDASVGDLNVESAAHLNAAIDSLREEIALVGSVTPDDSLLDEVHAVFQILYADSASEDFRGVSLSSILPENVPRINGRLPAGGQEDIACIKGTQENESFEPIQINMGQFNEESTPLDAIGQEEWIPDTSQLYSTVFSDEDFSMGSDQLTLSTQSSYPMMVDNEVLPSAVTPKKCEKNKRQKMS